MSETNPNCKKCDCFNCEWEDCPFPCEPNQFCEHPTTDCKDEPNREFTVLYDTITKEQFEIDYGDKCPVCKLEMDENHFCT